jgi:hypothetical protein
MKEEPRRLPIPLLLILFSLVPLQSRYRVEATVVLAPADSSAEPLNGVTLTLKAKSGGSEFSGTSANGGRIVIKDVPPAIYDVAISGLPFDAKLVYAIQGRRDTLKEGLDVRGDTELSILLSH